MTLSFLTSLLSLIFSSLREPADLTSSNTPAISLTGLFKANVAGARKSERKALIFLIAIRSNFPKNTKARHKNIKIKLKFLLLLNDFKLDGLPETIFSHS